MRYESANASKKPLKPFFDLLFIKFYVALIWRLSFDCHTFGLVNDLKAMFHYKKD